MSYRHLRKSSIVAITLRHFFNFVGYAGALLILYSVVCVRTGQTWQPIEQWIGVASGMVTLIGTILTAGSIYFYRAQQHPPERFSLFITAPVTIVGAVVAATYLMHHRQLPPHVLTGFTMLALAGAWFRIQPRPEDV